MAHLIGSPREIRVNIDLRILRILEIDLLNIDIGLRLIQWSRWDNFMELLNLTYTTYALKPLGHLLRDLIVIWISSRYLLCNSYIVVHRYTLWFGTNQRRNNQKNVSGKQCLENSVQIRLRIFSIYTITPYNNILWLV